ncbi:hypothetical protein BJY52DRAFT_1225935 [Lactarius psammicola]|nr:hypothetical protein BJY52DRAFT_1225935 [Lactarius psammicola]
MARVRARSTSFPRHRVTCSERNTRQTSTLPCLPPSISIVQCIQSVSDRRLVPFITVNNGTTNGSNEAAGQVQVLLDRDPVYYGLASLLAKISEGTFASDLNALGENRELDETFSAKLRHHDPLGYCKSKPLEDLKYVAPSRLRRIDLPLHLVASGCPLSTSMGQETLTLQLLAAGHVLTEKPYMFVLVAPRTRYTLIGWTGKSLFSTYGILSVTMSKAFILSAQLAPAFTISKRNGCFAISDEPTFAVLPAAGAA